nr:Crp/Fnr family transcriptional regulator [Rhodoferax sp.]
MKPSPAALRASLAVNPWFAALPLPVQENMVSRSTLLRLQSGEQMFRQGDMPRAWYGLLRGAVRLSTLRDDGKEHIMAVMEAGSWVGESALVVNQAYLNNATAQGPVEALALPGKAVEALMDQTVFARAMVALVTGRYRLLYEALGDVALRSTRSRIAQRLLLLTQRDTGAASASRQRVAVSQESLARMLGIARQTLSSELQSLAQQGIVRLGYRSIEVLSSVELRRISEGAAV